MNWFEKIGLVAHILIWRLGWSRHRSKYLPKGIKLSPKFISAQDAAALIKDGACVFSNGIAGNARCSIFFYAIRERFQSSGHPQQLTWINGGAQGSRGKVPGTIEEIGLPGLMKLYLSGHLETAKAQLKLADEGLLELHTLPQGVISRLLEVQGEGKTTLKGTMGLGSFLDPETGKGSAVTPGSSRNFVRKEGSELVFTMPQPEICLLSVPYADKEGNLYFKHATTITEDLQSIKSVRRHNGIVMAAVGKIIPKSEGEISIPAADVDHIVLNPFNEQTISVPQWRYWPSFTPKAGINTHRAIERLRFINTFLKITPVRGPIEQVMGRLAAALFVQLVPKKSMINIGVGFPEEVARLVIEHGIESDYIFTTEAGSYGGLPAPGIFFGAAIHPDHLEPSSMMFTRYLHELEVAVLGFLQVDSQGNVNVSKRGPRMMDYVGPGGFPDIVDGARKIIFIGNIMNGAEYQIVDKQMQLVHPGEPKFVQAVDEVTFNAQNALARGKEVYYVTNVGLFQLTKAGLKLIAVFKGIDVQKDILPNIKANILLPDPEEIVQIGDSIITGQHFDLKANLPLLLPLNKTTESIPMDTAIALV